MPNTSPEQKAQELVEGARKALRFTKFAFKHDPSIKFKCVLISIFCVEEIISNHYQHFDDAFPNVIDFWQSVLTILKSK